jgi:hypothetical protein
LRTFLALLLVLTIAPFTAAKPGVPDLTHGHVAAAGCAAGWSLYWPGETAGVRCGDAAGASVGTLALGDYACVLVLGGATCVVVP